MKLEIMVLGKVGTNCYIAMNEQNGEAIIIDPADRADKINSKLKEMGAKPVAILFTHGHFDHVLAANDLKKEHHIQIYANEKERETLENTQMNMSSMGNGQSSYQADVFVKDGQVLDLAGMTCKVIWTPGHTPGGTCYFFEEDKILFSGDTLFCRSVGRSDFPGGSMSELIRSIKEKLMILDDDVKVFPGHMGATTIKDERIYNPFIG